MPALARQWAKYGTFMISQRVLLRARMRLGSGAGETSAPISATAIGTGVVGNARTAKGRRAKTADAVNFMATDSDSSEDEA